MSRSLNILSLPDELISVILENTDYSALIACRRSCYRLKNILDSSSALTYTMELGATGMCDGTPNGVGITERLKRLQNSQIFWKNPVWSQPDHFPYSESPTMYPYPEAVSGNLVVFISDRPVDPTDDCVTLLLLRLPSELRGIQEQQWYINLEFQFIEEISADDSQDLLIFLSPPNIHIRTLSTGGIHPLTNTHGFIYLGRTSEELEEELEEGMLSSLCIYDDLLAFWIYVPTPHVLVLNWKTGEQIAKTPCVQSIDNCSFLDRTKIIFPYRVYDPEPAMHLRVVTLPNTPGDSLLCSYDFVLDILTLGRPYEKGCRWQQEYLSTNALPSNPSDSSFPGIFHVDPRNQLLVLKVETNDKTRYFQVLYVTQAIFSSYIATHPSDTDTVSVPWEAWGPGNTYIVNSPFVAPDHYHAIACGMHALIESTVFRDQKTLRVMDYHPGRIARILATHDDLACTEVTVTEAEIPYTPKDIPLPDGLQSEHIRCMVGEDVVVLLEYSWHEYDGLKIKSIFYHPI